jgi:hypothetical protein
MANSIKRSIVKDENVVIYPDATKINFWSASGLVMSVALLLPLFALCLIGWLVLYKLRIIRPARNPPQWGSQQVGQDGPFKRSSPR